MKRLALSILAIATLWSVSRPSTACAQGPIIVGPNSTLAWDVDVPTPAFAQTLTYNLVIDTAASVIIPTVTCAASVPLVVTTQTCSTLLAGFVPMGSHTLTMTSQSGTLISSASAPFAYVTLIVPTPRNLRLRALEGADRSFLQRVRAAVLG